MKPGRLTLTPGELWRGAQLVVAAAAAWSVSGIVVLLVHAPCAPEQLPDEKRWPVESARRALADASRRLEWIQVSFRDEQVAEIRLQATVETLLSAYPLLGKPGHRGVPRATRDTYVSAQIALGQARQVLVRRASEADLNEKTVVERSRALSEAERDAAGWMNRERSRDELHHRLWKLAGAAAVLVIGCCGSASIGRSKKGTSEQAPRDSGRFEPPPPVVGARPRLTRVLAVALPVAALVFALSFSANAGSVAVVLFAAGLLLTRPRLVG